MNVKPNVKLLRKIKKAILAEPSRLDMENWFNISDKIAPCGSTACIAGWAVALDYQSKTRVKWATAVTTSAMRPPLHKAARLLGLDLSEADLLFHVDNWPNDFADAYKDAARDLSDLDLDPQTPDEKRQARKLRREMARITADRIEHFIKKGE